MSVQGSVIRFKNQEQLDIFVNMSPTSQHIILDEDCLRLHCYYRISEGNSKRYSVQIKEENESMFDVRPSTDGGIMLINKNQVDLFEEEPVNV